MINGLVQKCFKVNSVEEKDRVATAVGDIIYVRNHPSVYLNKGNNEFTAYSKVYINKTHPKYNINRLIMLTKPYMFKIENYDD